MNETANLDAPSPADCGEINTLTMALECVLKTRGSNEDEVWARYQKLCKKNTVLPLWGQLHTALKRLWRDGKIRFITTKERKLVIRA